MRIMLVLDHPYTLDSAADVPHRRSFTAAVAAAAIRGAEEAGHVVDLVDLAAERFSPAMTREDLVAWRRGGVVDPQVLDYQQRLLMADHLVFAFPVWWEAMPAATKGFLDRVLTKGVVFEELPEATGNPFCSLMPRLQGVTVLSVMTTPEGVPLVVSRPPDEDPVQGHLRQDRGQEPGLAELLERHPEVDPRAAGDAGRHRGALRRPPRDRVNTCDPALESGLWSLPHTALTARSAGWPLSCSTAPATSSSG